MNEVPKSSRISWDAWQRDLRSIGFSNPLLNFEPNTFSQIDIQRSHPSGMSQLNASGRSVLSNLFRDPLAFSRAYSAAKRIKEHSEYLESQRGISALSMVAGLVNLGHAGFDLTLPILVWPITLNRKVDDFELQVTGTPAVNPGLVSAIETASGLRLDEARLLGQISGTADFLPVSLLNQLNEQVANRIELDITRVVAVGNFSLALVRTANDFEPRETQLLRQLAAVEPVSDNGIRVETLNAQSYLDEEVRLVLDADKNQRFIIGRALRGESFAVETLPGCGYTQTMVNLISNLSAQGKRVAVVAPRRQTLNELSDRLASLGLGGLAVRAHSTWLDVISAISRHEKAKAPNFDVAKVRYQAALAEVENYFGLLVSEDSKYGLTLTETLEQLAKLSILPKPPKTKARIPKANLLDLKNRNAALELLYQAQEIGEFDFDAKESLWFQARFENQEEADRSFSEVSRLANHTFPALREQIDSFVTKSNFKPGKTVEDWGNYLKLFLGIRETLARFSNDVFERPLDDLIVATGPRSSDVKMSGSNRRRLKKVAKEFLRPGMTVSDIHEALTAAREQRRLWKDYSLTDSRPDVPNGITDAMVSFRSLVSDLDELQSHLDNDDAAAILVRMPLEELARALNSMLSNPAPLRDIEKRNEIRADLKALGLTDLARDLATLKPAREQLNLELELAWWQSALEYLIARDPRVMSYSREQIEKVESNFREADAALVLEGAADLAWQQSTQWRELLEKHVSEAAALKLALQKRTVDLRELSEVAPSFAQPLYGVVMASPYELLEFLTPTQSFDTLIIADAAGTTVADNLAALKRTEQVIAFGDPAIGAPDGFTCEVQEFAPGRDLPGQSVFDAVAEAFGTEVLRKSWRPNGQTLGSFINREFYQNRIQFSPTPLELFGRSNLTIQVLSTGIGVSSTRPVESPDAEVNFVVEMVLAHAAACPEESLVVATPSPLHASRIRAQLAAKRKAQPEHDEWFDAHGREKFEVTDIATLSHRIADRIIFTIGFGTNQQGEAPSLLGDLSDDYGRRYLANLLVSARNRIDIVSCFGPGALDNSQQIDAHNLLRQVLEGAQEVESFQTEADPLLEDLALRLKKLGAHVVENFGGILPMVVGFGNRAIAVYPDWALTGDTLSEKLRLRPALLTAMGWHVVRIHSFEIFADPQSLAIRIAEELGMQVTKRAQPLFDEAAFDEKPEAWGDSKSSNDDRLRQDKPPHWG